MVGARVGFDLLEGIGNGGLVLKIVAIWMRNGGGVIVEIRWLACLQAANVLLVGWVGELD